MGSPAFQTVASFAAGSNTHADSSMPGSTRSSNTHTPGPGPGTGPGGAFQLDIAALQELFKTTATQGACTVSLITPEKDNGTFKVSAGEKKDDRR